MGATGCHPNRLIARAENGAILGVQFRFESFNFPNTPRFGQPNGGMPRAATGIINRADEPRRIQFGLKYVY